MRYKLITKPLLEKLGTSKAVAGAVGLGYFVQPLVLRFGQLVCKMLGVDMVAQKVDQMNALHLIKREDLCKANFAISIMPKIFDGRTAAYLEIGKAPYGLAIDQVKFNYNAIRENAKVNIERGGLYHVPKDNIVKD